MEKSEEISKELALKSEAYDGLKLERNRYLTALREIDAHIRSTSTPMESIISTLKDNLPEYEG